MDKLTWQLALSEITDVPHDGSHPFLSIARFVLTDDLPNGNGWRIPYEEFQNIKATAIGMPVKMDFQSGEAGEHIGSIPIGVIRDITEETMADGSHRLVAEAVLWSEEYPEEVAYLKAALSEGRAPGISYEMAYTDHVMNMNVKDLLNTSTLAATFVKYPAYGNRTALLALASMKDKSDDDIYGFLLSLAAQWTAAYVDGLPDSSFAAISPGGKKDAGGKTTPRSLRHLPYKDASGKIDLPHLRNALARVDQTNIPDSLKAAAKAKLAAAAKKAGVGQADMNLMAKDTDIDISIVDTTNKGGKQMDEEQLKELKEEVKALKAEAELHEAEISKRDLEIEDLGKSKAELEEEIGKLHTASLIASRTQKYVESGFTMDSDPVKAQKKKGYFASLSDEQWEEYLDDLIAIKVAAEKDKDKDRARADASLRQTGMPRLSASDDSELLNLKDQMRALARPNSV